MKDRKMQCRRSGQLGASVIDFVWLILISAIVAFIATIFGLGDSIEKVFCGILFIFIMIVLLAGLLGRIIARIRKKEKGKEKT